MFDFPLLPIDDKGHVFAWTIHGPVTRKTFFSNVAFLLEKIPDNRYVINLCRDRYAFLVGFSAALLRKQITLLPPNRVPESIQQLGESYPDCYYLSDSHEIISDMTGIVQDLNQMGTHCAIENFVTPNEQIAVIAFTSGSTGLPRPNLKSWGSLVEVAKKTAQRLHLKHEEPLTVVGTVPHQHMYGLETSIMLPLQQGWSIYSGRPFFSEDIRLALGSVPTKRILVSTPIHLRACMLEQTEFPALESILSATAPLSQALASQVETAARTTLTEIYGFAEAGTIATRQTAREIHWQLLDELKLVPGDSGWSVITPYFSDPIPIPDSIQAYGTQAFILNGRPSHMVNIGGHRTSLEELTEKLTSIDGVMDGVFYIPEEGENPGDRLVAFVVVIPGYSKENILTALRKKCDPVFLPRPLILLENLPRNPTGKLPREQLQILFEKHTSAKTQKTVS